MEDLDKDKLERIVEEFPRLESLALAVVSQARRGNLRALDYTIIELENYLTDTLEWCMCPACEVFNKAENLQKGDTCPECGEAL